MPKFIVQKIVILQGEVEAESREEAIEKADEGCASAEFQVADTTFKAKRAR